MEQLLVHIGNESRLPARRPMNLTFDQIVDLAIASIKTHPSDAESIAIGGVAILSELAKREMASLVALEDKCFVRDAVTEAVMKITSSAVTLGDDEGEA